MLQSMPFILFRLSMLEKGAISNWPSVAIFSTTKPSQYMTP